MKGRVLIVAGSDSGGGAGIQADIKSVTALGGYAATAITALTAQDTRGVHGVHEVPVAFVVQQMEVVLADLGADAIKTGMLHAPAIVEAVAGVLRRRAAHVPLVVDPVMTAKSGDALLVPAAEDALRRTLIPLATLITPNTPEAERLTGLRIGNDADVAEAGRRCLALGARYALLKGGHLSGLTVRDVLFGPNGVQAFESPRIDTKHTHGTGCTLASAIATGLAQGLDVPAAVARARRYVLEAIRRAPGYGAGHGPLDHGHTVGDF
ncbi:MAG: bifunctional hydroxymethylpyrimidine kinase/phosphomethylpyrimidine kinase [Alphaproteobacteria bacterium]|nr:bifunctional hydroxymethylpyrimidine kinase/phosphomethylpyrimidine kinase [Alphaproteobacteria bacterium]